MRPVIIHSYPAEDELHFRTRIQICIRRLRSAGLRITGCLIQRETNGWRCNLKVQTQNRCYSPYEVLRR